MGTLALPRNKPRMRWAQTVLAAGALWCAAAYARKLLLASAG